VIYYAESSFLFSAFASDRNTRAAIRWMRACKTFPLIVTRLGIFECENSFRTAVIDHRMTADEKRAASERIKRGLHEGFLLRREVPTSQWFPQAHRVSEFSSAARGFGALDILHVAAALVLRADGFLSFDGNQLVLAKGEGLQVEP
jgi:hypothetical protein